MVKVNVASTDVRAKIRRCPDCDVVPTMVNGRPADGMRVVLQKDEGGLWAVFHDQACPMVPPRHLLSDEAQTAEEWAGD